MRILQLPFVISIATVLVMTGLSFQLAVAQDKEAVRLFKIVSPRDEIVIGVKAQSLRSGTGTDVENLATGLTSKGQISAWQYAVKKGDDGSLRQAPLKQVVVLKHETIRIEPFTSSLPVVNVPAE
jgi:hypothetical protein